MRRSFCEEIATKNHTLPNETELTSKLETVNSDMIDDPPSPSFRKKNEVNSKNKKIFASKEDKRQAYMEIKTIFKTVTEDIGVLEDRLKENTVIEKVYLK